jgi:hypothetical protein
MINLGWRSHVSGIGMKMIMCLNETRSKFRVAKHLSASLFVKNSRKKKKQTNKQTHCHTSFQPCFVIYHQENLSEPG